MVLFGVAGVYLALACINTRLRLDVHRNITVGSFGVVLLVLAALTTWVIPGINTSVIRGFGRSSFVALGIFFTACLLAKTPQESSLASQPAAPHSRVWLSTLFTSWLILIGLLISGQVANNQPSQLLFSPASPSITRSWFILVVPALVSLTVWSLTRRGSRARPLIQIACASIFWTLAVILSDFAVSGLSSLTLESGETLRPIHAHVATVLMYCSAGIKGLSAAVLLSCFLPARQKIGSGSDGIEQH